MTIFKEVTYCSVFIFLILFMAGCAKDTLDPHVRAHLEKPDWIIGKDEKYNSSIYLTGRSVSARLSQAKRQSADDLVDHLDGQILKGLKKANPEDDQSSDSSLPDLTELLDEKTRNYLLQHIRIAETWQDPATHAYHILSVIDRVKVGDEMLNEIYRMDEQVARILNKAENEEDVLQRVAFANLAIEKQQQRDRLQAVTRIVKPVASEARSHWSIAKIKRLIGVWINEVKIMPIAQHKEFNLLDAMKDGVSSAGMTVHFGAKPDYILKGTFNQGQIKWKDGVYSLRGDLQLILLDGHWKGQVRGDANWDIEVSALEREDLPSQLANAIKQAHQKKLRNTLLSIED